MAQPASRSGTVWSALLLAISRPSSQSDTPGTPPVWPLQGGHELAEVDELASSTTSSH